jgi:hypothetical protein
MKPDGPLASHCLADLGKAGVGCPIQRQRSMMMSTKHEEGWDAEADDREDCHGRSPLDRLRHNLDIAVEDFMDDRNSKKQKARLRGVIYGLSFAIAVIENPYLIDQDRVTTEAWERYNEKEAE